MSSFLRGLVQDRVVMTVIVVNAVTLFLYAFPEAPAAGRSALYWLDYACTVFFVAEIVIKVSYWGWAAYWEVPWNRFDFIVVVISLPFLLSPFSFFALEEFSSILLLRLGRLFRLGRIFQFIPREKKIREGIARALRASVGLFLALSVYVLCLSIISYYAFSQYAPAYFGNPLLSLYSTFQIFTVEGWQAIPNAIADNASPLVGGLARLYFAFTVLTGGILGLSLANAVFVDEMVIDNTHDLEDEVETLQAQLQKSIEQSQARQSEIEERLIDLQEELDEREPESS